MRARFGAALVAAVIVLAGLVAQTPAPSRAANYVYVAIDLQGEGTGSWKTLASEGGVPDGWVDCRIKDGYVDPREICDQQFDAGEDGIIRIYYRVEAAVDSCVVIGGICQGNFSSYYDLGDVFSRTYTFNYRKFRLGVTVLGSGTVAGNDAEISCPPYCAYSYYYGDSITLTATANAGSYFDEWTGACAGQSANCVVTMTEVREATAYFKPGVAPTPIVVPSASPLVTPQATVKATPQVTVKPSIQPTTVPRVSAGTSPRVSAPASAAASAAAIASVEPTGLATAAPTALTGTLGPPSPAESATSTPPVAPTGSGSGSGSDMTPVILAILGGGLFIAIAIGLVGFGLLRRSRGNGLPPSS